MLTGRPHDRRRSPRVETNGELPGRLFDTVSGSEVICQSLDVSRIGLAIESEMEYAIESHLALELEDVKITLRIVSRTQTQKLNRAFRYGLIVEDGSVNLEELFRTKELLLHGAPVAKSRVEDPAPRFMPDQQLKIELNTFGTKNPYILFVENLSRSGLLVGLVTSETLPFRVTTLLDMVIDPKKEILTMPVRASGKVVRRVDEELPQAGKKAVRLGIVIVEIDPRDEAVWAVAIQSLEN